MGPRVMRRPPKFVQAFIDRHGKPRFYFRRPGFKKCLCRACPGPPSLWPPTRWHLRDSRLPSAARAVLPGSIRALGVSYFNSLAFRSMRSSSQTKYRRIIDRLCREHGDKRAAMMQREHVVKLMAARASAPESANSLRKILRAMMQHAIEIGLRGDDPTRDVKAIRVKSDGFHSWTEDEIAQFEQHHQIGSRARLALALLLYTGQRRSDVVRIGRQHVRNGFVSIRQDKTGATLEVPVIPELEAIIRDTPADHLTFLTTPSGKPLTPSGFSYWFKQVCIGAGLPHCSAHGLRKAAARRLAEAGCTAHEIAAITGHASLREVARYTKAADQKRLATSAMDKVRTSSVKPVAKFDKKTK